MPSAPWTEADQWRERARGFAEREVRPWTERIDREDRVPDELVRGLVREHFVGLGVPPEWDGVGGDTRCRVSVLEELAHASAAVAVLLAVHYGVCAAPIQKWGTERQKERFLRPLARGELIGAFGLTEPGVGSDTARLATRYARAEGGFVLNGSKMFISNAVSAGIVLVFATSDPTRGSHGISAFIVPPGTTGFSVAQRLDKLGLRGSETAELVLTEVRLPSESLLGAEGEGLHIALGALTGGRVGIASCALGVARASSVLAAAGSRGARAAARQDSGGPFEEAASVAKLTASRAAVSIASIGVDVAGPEGVRDGAAAERLWRDARVFPIVEGTTEIQELILARRLRAEDGGRTL